jgi:hypothetical protein
VASALHRAWLQVCLAARERAFLADPAVPHVIHLTVSFTNALGAVRLGRE